MNTDDELRAAVDVDVHGVRVTTGIATTRPGWFSFTVNQGAALSLPITWYDENQAPVDLSNSTAALTARDTWGDATARVSLTSSAGLTLAADTPTITVALNTATTAAYTGWTRCVYDLEVTTSNTTRRLLEGFVTLRKNVTT